MSLYTVVSEVELERPVLVSALSGWVDAAGAATTAVQHLASGAPVVAFFDSDQLFDYRSSRPILDIVEGAMGGLTWPELTLRAASRGGRNFVVLSGNEPDLRWRALAASVVEIAHRFGVELLVTLGAVPAAVPHTLPPPVLAVASRPELVAGGGVVTPPGLLRVPSAAVSVIERAVSKSGIDAVGYYVQVPHYVTGPWLDGALSLLGRLAATTGAELELGELQERAAQQRRELDEAVAAREETREYVARLEEVAGEQDTPSGEDLAAEIERFLRRQQGGQGNGPIDGAGPSA